MKLTDVAWGGIAGLCGGVVWLIVKQHVKPIVAVGVCIVSSLFGIFLGSLVGEYFGVNKAGAGFICGIAAMKISVSLVDGTALTWLQSVVTKKQ